MRTIKRVLVVGDPHARPGESLDDFERFYALGNLIWEEKPDEVVLMGDLWDMPSLNGWAGSRGVGGPGFGLSGEGADYDADLAAGRDALRAIKHRTRTENARHARNRHRDRMWEPPGGWTSLFGNHEDRSDRAREHHAQFRSRLGTWEMEEILDEEGWHYNPFLRPLCIEGVYFNHYFTAGNSRRPVSQTQALKKHFHSLVQGHNHEYQFQAEKDYLGERNMFYLSVGCFKAPKSCGPHEWSGVVMLHMHGNGQATPAPVDIHQVLHKYGRDKVAA